MATDSRTSIIVIDVREVGGHRDRRLRERMLTGSSFSPVNASPSRVVERLEQPDGSVWYIAVMAVDH